MSITVEQTPAATVVNIRGAEASTRVVEVIPGSAVREGAVPLGGGRSSYGITLQVRPAP